MNHPPRLAHLLTVPVLVSRLSPTCAAAHGIEDDYADERVETAMRGPLRTRLLDATWAALRASTSRPGDDELVEKVARSMAARPLRRAKAAAVTPGWSAFLLQVDVDAGVAGDAARRALESDAGRRAADEGIAEAGRFLAREMMR